MKILLFGATGYVGTKVKDLLKNDHQVFSISRTSIADIFEIRHHNHEVPKLVLSSSISEMLVNTLGLTFDMAINFAACVDKDNSLDSIERNLEANVQFVAKTALLCKVFNVQHYLNISTYSTHVNRNFYSPQTFYAASKKAGEDILEYFNFSGDFKVTHFHLYDVYGPNQPHNRFLKQLIKSLLLSEDFHMSQGEQEVNFIHVDDVAKAIKYFLDTNIELENESRSSAHYSIFGNEIFKLADIPHLVSSIIREEFNGQIIFDLPYRNNEIMTFSPIYPRLPGWEPSISLKLGLGAVISEIENQSHSQELK